MASNDSRAKLEQAEADDEDIFEGLAKRKSERIPAPPLSAPPRSSMVVPAAPPPPPGSVDARRTLLGLDDSPPPPSVRQEARQEARMHLDARAEERTDELYEESPFSQMPNSDTFRAALRAAPTPSFAPPPPPTATSPVLSNVSMPASAPPPPPGRGTLPRITVPPPPPSGNMAAAATAPPMEADWDDDKETLVYDKDNNPASLMPPASGRPASQPPTMLPQVKKTLVGVNDASARSFGESSQSSPSLSLSRTLNSANNPMTTPLSMPAQVRTEPLPIPVRPRPSFAALNNNSVDSQRPAPPVAAPSEPIVLPTNGGSPKAWLFGALGLVGLGLAAVGAFVALAPAKPGRLQVRVADARGANADRVEIFVDGKKACDTSPCTVESLTAGEHQVKLMAPGMETLSQSAAIVSGRELELPLALLPVKGAPVAAAPEAAAAAAAPAAATRGKVTLKLETEGAQVFLVDGSERRRVTELPSTIDALDMSKAWTLEATKPGFADFRLPLTFAAGETEKTVSIALEPLAKAGAASAAAPAHVEAKQAPAQAIAAPAPAAPKTSAPASAEAKAAPSAAVAAAQSGEGTLNLNSMPASAVIVDGRPVGQTPVLGLSVPSGNHTVVFMNSDQNLKKTLRVSVKQGETKAVVGKLRE